MKRVLHSHGFKRFLLRVLLVLALLPSEILTAKTLQLLNVSYDPTREFFSDYNKAFNSYWRQRTGDDVIVKQSHGGSSKQARSVLDGLPADVVTLALAGDIDSLSTLGNLLPLDWQTRLPYHSSPYYSTIVFLVRKNNPKQIKDWGDLVKEGISVITPNPKISGGARWNYLAAWSYALHVNHQDERKAFDFVSTLYRNVPVLDSGARGATTTFIQREIGDVLLCWENEAYLALKEFGEDTCQIIYPSLSIRAEPAVTWVDRVVNKKGTREVAKAYLTYLYSKEGQEIAANHYLRPHDPELLKANKNRFPDLPLVTIDQQFGGWAKAQERHFADGGTFDQIYKP
jgi:sulfate/thiosulfate transport system substrate-binding protein